VYLEARYDHLFDRKKHSPSHVYLASLALTVDTDILVTNSADLQDVSKPQAPLDWLPAQGTSLRTEYFASYFSHRLPHFGFFGCYG
jgi:hypothetical protein